MMNNEEIAISFILFLMFIATIAFGPMITIWSLNTLFGFSIPITLKTCFAMLWISGIVGGTAAVVSNINKK